MNAPALLFERPAAAVGLGAFEGAGIELEYMLVKRGSLDVAPIADTVLARAAAADGGSDDEPVSDVTHGPMGWSNELVAHVLEVKNLRPTADLAQLRTRLHAEVHGMNRLLERFDACLMPGGMHPWMDPARETRLWPYGNAAVYRTYDRIFDCRSHGWANLQSMHLNLPFRGPRQFARLHTAVRLLLPILPAIAASSPFADGRAAGWMDYRMQVYRENSRAIPCLTGQVVPEPVSSPEEYERALLRPMYRAVAPYDPKGVLRHEWLNSRGAIARFDRSAIEIRVLDAQECPQADVALAALIFDLAESLYRERWAGTTAQQAISTETLARIFLGCARDADRARIDSPEYLRLLGMKGAPCEAKDVWRHIAESLDRARAPHRSLWMRHLAFILTRGPLARRLRYAAGPAPDRAALLDVYTELCACLEAGRCFEP
jgi:carboxylate-amine ligase